jgi:hypothetical protein
MAQHRFTEVSYKSWGTRIGESIKGVVFGLVLFLVAFPILIVNEGRAVSTARALEEGARIVISVAPEHVDPANEGRLVHVIGHATTTQVLNDPEFAVTANVLKLARVVEMYQWREETQTETRTRSGGGEETVTVYSYRERWSWTLIDSSRFRYPGGHTNPTTMPFEGRQYVAQPINMGAFTLSRSIVDKLQPAERITVTSEMASQLPPELRDRLQVHDGRYYLGANPVSPQIGDTRISFLVLAPSPITVVAKQVGATFESYRPAAGDTIEMVRVGSYSAEHMFAEAMAENVAITWMFRLMGALFMFIGLFLVLRPLTVLADVVPFIGGILRAGTVLISGVIALSLSTIVIALAWIAYRPLLGIPLLVAALGAVVLLQRYGAKKRAGSPVAPRSL